MNGVSTVCKFGQNVLSVSDFAIHARVSKNTAYKFWGMAKRGEYGTMVQIYGKSFQVWALAIEGIKVFSIWDMGVTNE
jgi:hypothetical protein